MSLRQRKRTVPRRIGCIAKPKRCSAVLAIAGVSRARGNLADAGSRFLEALGLFRQLRHRRGIAILLEGCAQLSALQGRAEQALVMTGAARQLRDTIAVPGRSLQQARLEQALAPVRRAMDPEAARAHWMEGAAMPLAAAINYALTAVRSGA